ncbi:MAG: DUF3087 domain-containing protein [Colwellia sp.]
MQLIKIDKARYRKHLNRVIVGFICTLLVLSLVFGSVLIHFLSDVDIAAVNFIAEQTSENPENLSNLSELSKQESNFKYNLLGVVLSLLACAAILHSLKSKPFFTEIYYVWQVKQLQNSIFRKLKKIKIAAGNDDINALIILIFYYQSLKQIYLLDDNTLTISTVNKNINDLQETIANKNLTINAEQFDKKLLASYA